jgi:hypothetical protein
MSVRSTFAAALAFAMTTVFAASTGAQVPGPAIEGPIASPESAFIGSTTFDLAQVGYEQAEYFMSGTASAYTSAAPLGADGIWSLAPGETAAYTTRLLVYRPTKPRKFSGTVVVEWNNVSAGVDSAPAWIQGHVELIRAGVAWVGVSAQIVGVEGGTPLAPVLALPLKTQNPARYGSLHHPGDSFAYDIFSQAGQAIRSPSGPSPLGSLEAKRLIAVGESQSAITLANYVNGVHPLVHVYDGFLIYSRSGSFGFPLSRAPQPAVVPPGNAIIRTDIDVPVLVFETESDVTVLGYFAARQEDSRNFRLWEVAGTAHSDAYGIALGMTDIGNSPDIAAVLFDVTSAAGGLIECAEPVNSGPQHYVLNAALNKLIRWVRTGKAPKPAPRLDVDPGPPVSINRDEHGNALGGIRTPWVDAPIATFADRQQTGSILCIIFGTTTPFDATKLAALYPTRKAFRSAHSKALRSAVRKGWILKPDARLIRKWAAGSGIGG